MSGWNRQEQRSTIYTEEQIKRSITGSGLDISGEVDSDFIVFCPFHNNFRSPAGEVSKTNGTFYCFSCRTTKTLEELVMFISKRTYFEAVRFIGQRATESNISDAIETILNKKPEFQEFDKELIKRLHQQAVASTRATNYFNGRGITRDSMDKYLLGYSDKQDMITIPITSPDGMYIGFVGRSIEGKEFKNTPGLPKSKTLFNISRAKKYNKVFVVESSFDAIKIEQAGGHAVATLGATVSNAQKEILRKYFNDIIVVGDNDEAGQGMVQKLCQTLGHIATQGILPNTVKDISDLNDDELKLFIEKFDNTTLAMLK
jgi:DNA primase